MPGPDIHTRTPWSPALLEIKKQVAQGLKGILQRESGFLAFPVPVGGWGRVLAPQDAFYGHSERSNATV
jgi:hypothetical protein